MDNGYKFMIGCDDTLQQITELVNAQKHPEDYERAMNRIRYEMDKDKGTTVRVTKYLHLAKYDYTCNNCGSSAVKEVVYNYCPICGYRLNR